VLIVEDDLGLGALLTRVLAEEGASSKLCTSVAAGLSEASGGYDAILLDWMLPDGDGPTFCQTLRRANDATPVLMLTARGELGDRVTGLRAGADDYLVKPFEIEELLARLEALVRRNARGLQITLDDLVIDRLRRRCSLRGKELDLTAREYELLERLAQDVGKTVTRATLLKDVWRMDFDPGSGLLDVQISRLRDKLGADAFRIETVRGTGYRLKGGS
jgi:DNA-binding response OmpR family regulator